MLSILCDLIGVIMVKKEWKFFEKLWKKYKLCLLKNKLQKIFFRKFGEVSVFDFNFFD